MAALVGAKAMLGRMGLNDAAQTAVTDSTTGEGLIEVNQFARMSKKAVEHLCKVLRRPGGGGNGVVLSAQSKENLQAMMYFIKHRKRTCRPVVHGDVTLDKILKLVRQRETEAAHTDPLEPPTIDAKDWPKTLEAVVEWIGGFRGVDGHPLSYGLRDNLVPKASATDPTVGEVDSEYLTYDEELIARGRIIDGAAGADPEVNGPFRDAYIIDRAKIWVYMTQLFQDTDAWPYMKVCKRKKDGRAAYLAAFNHFLGPHNIDHLASAAEKKLAQTTYYGEKKNWNFEKYATEHKRQHNILESLVEHGYTGIDRRSKVRFLNDGIKTATLNTVKTRIMSDAALRNNFDGSVTLYKDFIKHDAPAHDKQSLGISAVGADGRNITIEDKYYDKEVWWQLSNEERAQVIKLRGKRSGGGGGRGGKSAGGGRKDDNVGKKALKKQVAKLQAKTANQKRQLAALNAKVADDSEADAAPDSSDDDSQATGNRTHSALTRQKKSKKNRGKGN